MTAERIGLAFEVGEPATSAHRVDRAADRVDRAADRADRASHRIDRAVLAWGRWYTRDLLEEVAADRIAELESDLFEERAAAGDAAAAGRSIVGRAIRGVPADLAWRVARLRGVSLTAPNGTFPLALPALAHVATAMLLAWGVLIVVRVGAGMLDGSWSGARDLVAAGVVGLGLALIGSALTLVPEARWLGALWLAVASYVLLRFGMYALIATSTTLSAFYTSALAEAILINRVMSAAGVLFFVSMAAWWLPSARALWAARPDRVHRSPIVDPEGTTA